MYLDRIVDALTLPTPRPYTPNFRVESDRLGSRIFDGDLDIAVYGTVGYFWFDIFRFAPGAEPIMANLKPPRHVVDLHTNHNTAINLPGARIKDLTEGVDKPERRLVWEWVVDRGAELHGRLSAEYLHGQRLEYNMRIGYSPERGQYTFTFDVDAWKLAPDGGEPLNMMMAGALTSRPEERRWGHSLWEDPFGKLRRMVHSNALFSATDYGPAEWRHRNAPDQGAWMAYAGHAAFNPCMLVHHANPSVYFAICSQLFDEHIIWTNGGFDDLDEDGFFHFTMRTEFVNLPAAVANTWLAEAQDPPRPRRWRESQVSLPFYHDIVNDLETPIDPWLPEECPVMNVERGPDGDIQWAEGVAHSGSHSIRFTQDLNHGRTTLYPSGAVFRIDFDSRYRFSAWVKTENVARFARIELYTYEYTFHNVIDIAQSPTVGGTSDWTRIEVELDTHDEAYIMPHLLLYGTGSAWFDDLQLIKL